jgi:hypothetical protein
VSPRRNPWSARPVPTLGAGTWAAAGNRFTKQRLVPPLPISAYTGKITGVPLTGGQNQGLIPGTTASGTFPSPPSFSVIAVLTFPADGTYTVSWTVSLAGTVSAVEQNNFALYLAGVTLEATSVNPAADGTYIQASVQITTTAGTQLFLTNPATGTAGSIYGGTMAAALKGSSLTLSVGPQGLGTTWYPAQVTLSTTTGVLDTSTALVFLGIGGVPTMQVASVFSGNGVAALAIPPMQPGEFVIVTWTGGHPGDTASMNVLGTMDALTTGR